MSYVTIEDRVDRLEALFGQFITEMAVTNKRADDRQRAAEERHCAAEERMNRFEKEMRESRRELNKKWGDLSNKLGTIIEDILAPNLLRLASAHFGFESILDFMIRRYRRSPKDLKVEGEFDTIVVGEKAVILGEAKSTPSLEYADEFAEKARTFFDFFPEYDGRRLILIFGSWAISDSIVKRLTRHGIYALHMGEHTMELANAVELEAS